MQGAPAALGVTSKTPPSGRDQQSFSLTGSNGGAADKLAERRQHDLSLARENTWA